MKLFFAACVIGLGLLSAALYWTQADREGDVPVITWITQNDENKRAIVDAFHQWIKDEQLPPVELRIDNTNQDPTKKLVQGVSGVGADLLDLYMYEQDLFPATGMIADITEDAKRLGFTPDATYPALRGDLVVLGRQHSFPRNAGGTLYWVNRETFAKYGLPAPPWRWNSDEFEALGRKFVAAANPPGARQRIYFANGVSRDVLRRGLGLSTFNETGTFCTLDDPRNVSVLARVRRWVLEDRLFPTKEEDAAMAADITGYGSMFSHFTSGRFAMIYTGHWGFIMIRPRGVFQLAAVEPPQDGFPNTEMGGGSVAIYVGTKQREHALRFLQFLTSDPFNRLIVRQADSLPPVPRYAETEEFLHPAGRENEWGVHGAFAHSGRETGILYSRSPFVLFSQTFRIEIETYEAMIAGRLTPAEAAKQMADRINTEIRLTIARNERLRTLYEERLELQRRIEERRAGGRPVPAAWVTDAFHLAYYRAHGWLEEETKP
ncbi:MAG: carbohydrate ABC transporter substrate-binding protein [Opitutaceae bacterium]|nr:carbohydrate ABC transporter substrate-binding protein [Opitutaceae bacterium]